MASSKQGGAGFSLVEVLVSIVVSSMGLLGAVHMLLVSVRSSSEAAAFTTAVHLVRELSEKARMNKGIAQRNDAANAYLVEGWAMNAASVPAAPACAASGAACNAAELAKRDMREWTRRVAEALPEARMAVCFDEMPQRPAAGERAWACSHSGRRMVVKLGWTSHAERPAAQPERPPRLVMQVVAGPSHDGHEGP